MVKLNVNNYVKRNVNSGAANWEEALKDAETAIQKANRELADWKATAAICRRMVAKGKPWPGAQPSAAITAVRLSVPRRFMMAKSASD